MVIRCERCSTTYELDESLLAPAGSEVQCTKCQHVFTAFPSRSAGRTLAGVAAQPPAAAEPQAPRADAPRGSPRPASASTRPSYPAAASRSEPAGPRPEGAGPKPVRTAPAQVYRPQASSVPAGSAPVSRAPVLKRDTVGTFEARLRWSARWRWLAPVLAGGIAVLLVAGWALLGRRGDAGAERTRDEALALLALDDAASVEDAASRLAAIVKKRPKLHAAAADRALALVVRAAGVAEEGEALAARAAAAREERERARREQGPGWEASERAAYAEANAVEPEIRSREEKARALSSGAREQLGVLQAEAGETLEVARALAALHALAGERDRLHRVIRTAREKGLHDPWLDLAEGWGDTRDPDRSARERALVKLGGLAAARPDLVRGRFLLARAQLSLGRKADALATADGVLAANDKHEGARRLREELTAPPPAPPPAAPPPPPAAGKPPPPPRKFIPQPTPARPAPGAAAPAPGGTAGAAGPPAPPQPAPAPDVAPAPPLAAPPPAPQQAAPPFEPPPARPPPPPAPPRRFPEPVPQDG